MSEHDEQVALFQQATLFSGVVPELDLLHAIPLGGLRNKVTAKRLKAEGVKPGVPDLFLPVARHGYHGLYIELKVKPNRPTHSQLWWLEKLEGQGFAAVVSYGAEEAWAVLMGYLGEEAWRSHKA